MFFAAPDFAAIVSGARAAQSSDDGLLKCMTLVLDSLYRWYANANHETDISSTVLPASFNANSKLRPYLEKVPVLRPFSKIEVCTTNGARAVVTAANPGTTGLR
jgi:hypothetical protein